MYLGTLGKTTLWGWKRRKLAPFAAAGAPSPINPTVMVPVDGIITGVVKINNVPAPGVLVRIYYRQNGILIDQAKADQSGAYTFYGLNTADPKAYYVTFMDPSSGAPYNYTVTKDHLTAG